MNIACITVVPAGWCDTSDCARSNGRFGWLVAVLSSVIWRSTVHQNVRKMGALRTTKDEDHAMGGLLGCPAIHGRKASRQLLYYMNYYCPSVRRSGFSIIYIEVALRSRTVRESFREATEAGSQVSCGIAPPERARRSETRDEPDK